MGWRDGKLFRVWAAIYRELWGGLKHRLLPHTENSYAVLLGPGRGVRVWTNPAHGGTRVLLGHYEPPLMRWLERVVKPGSTFYDVGSNDGHIALIAAKLVGQEGCVYAFEQDTETRKCLQRNLELNPDLASRIHVVPYSVGRIHDVGAAKLSLDGFAAEATVVRAPDAIKVDVEGAEDDVLVGMRQLLNDRRPALFIECHSLELHRTVKRFVGDYHRDVGEAVPSLLEVSRQGYNSWVYVFDV